MNYNISRCQVSSSEGLVSMFIQSFLSVSCFIVASNSPLVFRSVFLSLCDSLPRPDVFHLCSVIPSCLVYKVCVFPGLLSTRSKLSAVFLPHSGYSALDTHLPHSSP